MTKIRKCLKCGAAMEASVCLYLRRVATVIDLMMPGKNTVTTASLVDIDWKIGVVTASSVPGLKGKTYLQLKLMLEKEDHSEESVLTELDIATFYELFHALKKAAVALDEYT